MPNFVCRRRRWLVPSLAGLVLALLALVMAAGTDAQTAEVLVAPAADSLLATSPERLEVWLTEAVDPAAPPRLRLFDSTGNEIAVGATTVDTADPRHITADLDPLDAGSYTIGWSARATDDGQLLSGTSGFRVDASPPLGVAMDEGDEPTVWAIITRWLTFFGVALAAGGFLNVWLVANAGATCQQAILGGTMIALLATAIEPVLQVAAPAGSADAMPLSVVTGQLEIGWWLRLIALLLLTAVALLPVASGARGATVRLPLAVVGIGLGLLALAGLALTSHAAFRPRWDAVAFVANLLHLGAAALFAGNVAHLLLRWSSRRWGRRSQSRGGDAAPEIASPRRLVSLWLALLGVAIVAGAVAAGLVLPSPRDLVEGPYGVVLLIKALVVLVLAALTLVQVAGLRSGAGRHGRVPGTLRAAWVLALLVVFGGSLLATLAPPGRAAPGDLSRFDLATEAPLNGVPGIVHLQLQPATPGENAVFLRLTDEAGGGVAPETAPQMEITFSPLDHQAAAATVRPVLDPSGGYAVGTADLSGEGWWQAAITLTPPTGEPLRVGFYLLLPDPNVSGVGYDPAGSAEARQLFETGLANMEALHSVRFNQRLGDGAGTLYTQETLLTDGSDGQPAAWRDSSASFERIIVGQREWLRNAGQPWTERPASSLYLPPAWGETYAPATDFRLGEMQEIDGERCRIVTFRLPAVTEPRRMEAAWYAWWVGEESGQVRQEAMVSRRHYMIYRYNDFDAPLSIEPPANAATPAAGG